MLVLTRKIGETIILNDDISVTVIGFKGQQIRLGIEAPASVSVHREEIYNQINSIEKNPARLDNKTTKHKTGNISTKANGSSYRQNSKPREVQHNYYPNDDHIESLNKKKPVIKVKKSRI